MGVVVIGGGGSGGGGGPKLVAQPDGSVTAGETVVAMFANAEDAERYAAMLSTEARVIPFATGLEAERA